MDIIFIDHSQSVFIFSYIIKTLSMILNKFQITLIFSLLILFSFGRTFTPEEIEEQTKIEQDLATHFQRESDKYYKLKAQGILYTVQFPKSEDYAKRAIDWKGCFKMLGDDLCLELFWITKFGGRISYGSYIIASSEFKDSTFKFCIGEGFLIGLIKLIGGLFGVWSWVISLVIWIFGQLPFTFLSLCAVLKDVKIESQTISGEGSIDTRILCWRSSCVLSGNYTLGKFSIQTPKNASLNFEQNPIESSKDISQEKEVTIKGIAVHLYNDRDSCLDNNYHQTLIYERCVRLSGNKGMRVECSPDQKLVRFSYDCNNSCGSCKNSTVLETNKCVRFLGSASRIQCSGTVRYRLREGYFMSSSCSESSFSGFRRYYRPSACVYNDQSSYYTCDSSYALERYYENSFTCNPRSTIRSYRYPLNRCSSAVRGDGRYRKYEC